MTNLLLGRIHVNYYARGRGRVFLDKTAYGSENVVNILHHLSLFRSCFGGIVGWNVLINDGVKAHIPGMTRVQHTAAQDNVILGGMHQAAGL